jgi:hypothetical protein
MHNVYKLFIIAKKKTMASKEVTQIEESVEESSEEQFDEGVFDGLDALSEE